MNLDVDVIVARGDFRVEAAFEADGGQTLALLGPNGSGKSTLVLAIAGLLPPSRGAILLDGTSLDDAAAGVHVLPERRHTGVVFQDLLLFPHLSALENVAFPLRATGVTRTEAHQRAFELLERLDVAARARARPRDLSGGEAQRVALARALVDEPALLLLDEPTSSLDVGARARARDLLRTELDRFPGVRVLVTHDPVEASMLADRLVLLEDGAVSQIWTPDEFRFGPRSRFAADLVGVNYFEGRLEPLDGGAARLITGSGELVVPLPEWPEVEDVIALLRPADVVLHRARPEGSARNVIRGRILSVAIEGERARVRLDAAPPLLADVTVGSAERLGLRAGEEVWASFKTVEVELLPR